MPIIYMKDVRTKPMDNKYQPQIQTGWRPFETAPKDGTIIDFWQEGRRLAGWWWDTDEKVWMNDAYAVIFPGAGSQPTHWMPLPLPPDINEPVPPPIEMFHESNFK